MRYTYKRLRLWRPENASRLTLEMLLAFSKLSKRKRQSCQVASRYARRITTHGVSTHNVQGTPVTVAQSQCCPDNSTYSALRFLRPVNIDGRMLFRLFWKRMSSLRLGAPSKAASSTSAISF